jgi:TPR repeat protein
MTQHTEAIAKAQAGDLHAQWSLGLFEVDPWGNTFSGRAAAIYWLKKAARGGHKDAIAELVQYYDTPREEPWSAEKAVYWYHRLAHWGDSYAHYRLGWFYMEGLGAPWNEPRAVRYLREAARLRGEGSRQAKRLLGICYRDGRGVAPDANAAYQCFHAACADHASTAPIELGDCYRRGIGTPVNMLAAANTYENAARCWHPGAQAMIGHCYYSGDGRSRDLVWAYYWLNCAADRGERIDRALLQELKAALSPDELEWVRVRKLDSKWVTECVYLPERSCGDSAVHQGQAI